MTSAPDQKRRTLIDLTLRNEQFMRIARLCISPLVNFILFLVNAGTALSQSSHWAATLAVYFATLCFMGSFVAACTVKPERHSERKVLAVCGIVIIFLALVITFIKYQIVGESQHDVRHPYFMFALAAITFAVAVTTIINATKARHGDNFQQAFLRIAVATMLGMLMMLEQQMFGTFAELTTPTTIALFEIISGAIVALILVAMGIFLLVKARKVQQ